MCYNVRHWCICRCYEMKATLPGESILHAEVWDYDKYSANDFVGKTSIDLEDRWFEQAWQLLGAEYETPTRFRPKPVETRSIMNPTCKQSQVQRML